MSERSKRRVVLQSQAELGNKRLDAYGPMGVAAEQSPKHINAMVYRRRRLRYMI